MTRINAANRLPHGDGIIGLLSTILASGQPKLTDAACVGKAELFDATNAVGDDIEKAKALCARCRCLTACADWAGRQRELTGVWAGEFHQIKRYDRDELTGERAEQ